MPPSRPQSPTATTNFGSGVACHVRRSASAMLRVTGPVTRQTIGMARRGDEVHAEPLEVVVRPGEPGDLELAAVARAGVDLADRERAAEAAARPPRPAGSPNALDLAGAARRLGDDARAERGPELAEHGSAPCRPARFLAELAQHGLGAGQLVVEDASRHVEEVADERHRARRTARSCPPCGPPRCSWRAGRRAAATRATGRGRGGPGAPGRSARRRGGARGSGCGAGGPAP